jgi:hypothetical protein
VFTPSGGLPSAGRDLNNPRKIVVNLSPQIADLGGNTLSNAGTIAFTPERILFEPIVIDEPFVDPSREDSVRTGSAWGGGFLDKGPGGGAGRLGDLIVLTNTTVVLNTDHEDFTGITNPAIFNPDNILEHTPGQPFAVDGGVFEFSRLRVDAGGFLRFEGSHPARIYVRGVADIQGEIDVSGASATLHAASAIAGGDGGFPGPNGGSGGRGGNRPDGSNFRGTFNGAPIGGVVTGQGPSNVLDPSTYTEVNGESGGGIAVPNTLDPTPTFIGGGEAGLGWPQPTSAHPNLHMPANITDLSGLEFDPLIFCQYPVPAAPGAGGAHALDGKVGHATFDAFSPATPPPDAAAGDNSALGVNDTVRSLSPEDGLLRGGGGGGGGGAHLEFTAMNGIPLPPENCTVPLIGTGLQISTYLSHSAAGGGGGGGGLQVVAGRRMNLAGVLDASGGDGGSGTFPPTDPNRTDLAQAGGAGAGGSVLLQAPRIQIQAVPGRIDVTGGTGGEGTGSFAAPDDASDGGRGSPGFVRLEGTPAPTPEIEESKIVPLEADLKAQFGPLRTIEEIFTTAEWQPTTEAPSGWSGAQSCWIRPTGSFFKLVFASDTPGNPAWDMRLRIAGESIPQSFRGSGIVLSGAAWTEGTHTLSLTGAFADYTFAPGDSVEIVSGTGATPGNYAISARLSADAIQLATSIGAGANGQNNISGRTVPGTTLEQIFGSAYGTSPVVVRFQGARAVNVLVDPCAVIEAGAGSPLAPGSLTGWLNHPDELNTFHADPSLAPNIFRFVVLWDSSQPEFAQIDGVEDLFVTIQPD